MLVIAQITDCHVVEAGRLLYDSVDTATRLEHAIAHLNAMRPKPDLVLATGALVNEGLPAQYDNLERILAGLDIPLYAIPGNHDIPSEVRARFGRHLDAQQADAGPRSRARSGDTSSLDYVVELGELRLIGLDTSVPNENGGQLNHHQLSWLDATLGAAPDVPAIVFQHHPPFVTGIAWMDESGLADGAAEASVLARHPQVAAVLCGHIHRPIQSLVGATLAMVCPSTGVQVALALDGTPYGYVDEPGSVGLHLFAPETGLVSHISQVGSPTPWIPPWARELL